VVLGHAGYGAYDERWDRVGSWGVSVEVYGRAICPLRTEERRRKKVLKYAKGYFGNKSKLFPMRRKPSSTPGNMPTATAGRKKAIGGPSGSCASTPPAAPPASATTASLKASRAANIELRPQGSRGYCRCRDEVAFNALVAQAQDALKTKAAAKKG